MLLIFLQHVIEVNVKRNLLLHLDQCHAHHLRLVGFVRWLLLWRYLQRLLILRREDCSFDVHFNVLRYVLHGVVPRIVVLFGCGLS